MIYVDNQAAMNLAETSAYKPNTKHIDIKYHFVREHIEKGDIAIQYISTDKMIADSLTKPLFKQKHSVCSEGMGLKEIED